MDTRKRSLLRAGVAGLLGAAALFLAPQADAQTALVASDLPAGLLVWPKIDVDLVNGKDTVIEIANTSTGTIELHCFYVNALGRCSISGGLCLVNYDCPGAVGGLESCESEDPTQGRWVPADFVLEMSSEQVLGWRVSDGIQSPCPAPGPFCGDGQNHEGAVTGRDPFRGELKCVQVDPDGLGAVAEGVPIAANDMIGKATLFDTTLPDVGSYNAVGIQSTGVNDNNTTLCLGADSSGPCTTAEYAACPATLILDHYFEGAVVDSQTVTTKLTLVPCTEFETPRPGRQTPDTVRTTAQFLVFNEFEQRYSTSTSVECYDDILLADVDTRRSFVGDNTSSIFSVGLEGTLTGQTRIRGVSTAETDAGHGLLGVAVEVHAGGPGTHSAAVNLNAVGQRPQADIMEVRAN